MLCFQNGSLRPLRRVDPAVPRDLCVIIDKACAPDPAHRYQTAGALLEDLQRFLEGRPIRARRVTSIETVWRWCLRNPVVAGLAACTALAVLAAAFSGWIAYANTTTALSRERRATDRAEANLGLTLQAFEDIFDEVSGHHLETSVVVDPETGTNPIVSSAPVSAKEAQLLQRILLFYGRFADRNAGNVELQVETA